MGAKIKFDVSNVETSNFEQPKPGTYRIKIVQCDDKKPDGKDRRLEVVMEIQDKQFKGARLWNYINLESEAAAWKLREFLEALGLVKGKKASGSFDPAKLIGEECMVRVVGDTYNGEYRARPGKMFALPEDEGDEDEDDDDDEEEDEDEDDADNEAESDEDEDDESDEEDDEEDDEDDEEEEVDLSSLSLKELKALAKERGVTVPKGSKSDDILALLEEGDDDDEDEEEDDDGDEYDDMDLAALKKECKERGLKAAGAKPVLIGRLRKDDATDPF